MNPNRANKPGDPPRRRGLTSVVVLIALIIIAIVCAGLLKVASARRSEVGNRERKLQAELLAESGLERASARLSASADYPGETWEVPAEDLGGRGAASVVIKIEKLADQPASRKVHVQADYPTGSNLRTRQSKELIVQIPPTSR